MSEFVIGVISDTHGLFRPGARRALEGVNHILHAGDIGEELIYKSLRSMAALTAIRGNVDRALWCDALPDTETVELGGLRIHMLHDLFTLDLDPVAAGISAVIYGHTHRPSIEWKKGVLYFNPGAAGPKRPQLPISVGKMTIRGGKIEPELIELLP